MTKRPDFSRYRRQLALPGVGEEGQEKLFKAKVLVIGAGGLGSPVLYYLAAAGVGTLGIVDNDTVDPSNLQRQILHCEQDLNSPKVVSAGKKLELLNSEVKINTYQYRLGLNTAKELFPGYDIIVAAVDNRSTRRIINQICYDLGKPWIEGGVNQFSGLVTTFKPPKGPCYNCLYNDIMNEDKNIPSLLGTLAGVIGLLQAQEVLKLILGIGSPLTGRLLIYDALETRFESIEIVSNPACPVCGRG